MNMPSYLFKIWSKDSTRKCFIVIDDGPNMYERLILKASEKLNINGSTIISSDGTPVTDDEVLIYIKDQQLILLEPGQSIDDNMSSATSLASTISIVNSNEIDLSNVPLIESQNFTTAEETANSKIDFFFLMNEEYNWSNYSINWEKMPTHIIAMCEKGQYNKSILTEICHLVVSGMRQIKKNIPTKAFKMVSAQMVRKYPQFFADKDDDNDICADGTCVLFNKLQERNFYLNRLENKSKALPITESRNIKRKQNAMAGCSMHQDQEIENENRDPNTPEEDSLSMLKNCYVEHRKVLENFENPPSIRQIKEQWPILLSKEAIFYHFNKLTGKLLEDLPTKMTEKWNKLLEFGIKHNLVKLENIDNKIIATIKLFTDYFKEDFGAIYIENKDSSISIFDLIKIKAPCIVFEDSLFSIYIEREVYLRTSSIEEAFQCMFGLYYMLCLEYPKEVSNTLEMIQRYYFKIHPDNGSKSKKNKTRSKVKVISLIKKLSFY